MKIEIEITREKRKKEKKEKKRKPRNGRSQGIMTAGDRSDFRAIS